MIDLFFFHICYVQHPAWGKLIRHRVEIRLDQVAQNITSTL